MNPWIVLFLFSASSVTGLPTFESFDCCEHEEGAANAYQGAEGLDEDSLTQSCSDDYSDCNGVSDCPCGDCTGCGSGAPVGFFPTRVLLLQHASFESHFSSEFLAYREFNLPPPLEPPKS